MDENIHIPHILSFKLIYSLQKNKNGGGGIGGGLRLMHGFSTMILVKEMGMNCMVNQQVTIGWANGGVPTIGNNV